MTLTHQTGPAAVKETLRAPAAPQVLVLSDLSCLKPLDMYGVEQVVTSDDHHRAMSGKRLALIQAIVSTFKHHQL